MNKKLLSMLAAVAVLATTPALAQKSAEREAKDAAAAAEKAAKDADRARKNADEAAKKANEQKTKLEKAAQDARERAAKATAAQLTYKQQTSEQKLAKDMIGSTVVTKAGDRIGPIEDIIFDTENQIQGVIVGVGGFAGVGEKKIAVRYNALKFSRATDGARVITLDTTRDVLRAAEVYQRLDQPKKASLVSRVRDAAKKATAPAAADKKAN